MKRVLVLMRSLLLMLPLCGCTGSHWHQLVWLGQPEDSSQGGAVVLSARRSKDITPAQKEQFVAMYNRIVSERGLIDVSDQLRKDGHVVFAAVSGGPRFRIELCRRVEGIQYYIHMTEVWSPSGRSVVSRRVEADVRERLKNQFGATVER